MTRTNTVTVKITIMHFLLASVPLKRNMVTLYILPRDTKETSPKTQRTSECLLSHCKIDGQVDSCKTFYPHHDHWSGARLTIFFTEEERLNLTLPILHSHYLGVYFTIFCIQWNRINQKDHQITEISIDIAPIKYWVGIFISQSHIIQVSLTHSDKVRQCDRTRVIQD